MKLNQKLNKEDQLFFFDDMLGAGNVSQKDESFIRGRQEALDVYYISQS